MAAFARLLALLLAALTLSAPASAGRPPLHPRLARGVRTISIRSEAGVSVRVTRAATVATIVRWFNSLEPFKARPCPLLVHEPATVTFKFLGPGNALTTAVDRNPGTCDDAVSYGNGLQVRFPALADDHLVARVSRLLGVDFEPNRQTVANERAAKRDAASLLRLASVPAGSRRVTTAGAAASTPGATALVDRHLTWKVRLSLDSVDAFETAHRPKGSRQTEEGTGSDRSGITSKDLTFSFPQRAGISSRELLVEMTRLSDGWTEIRVDAHDVWVVARPSYEKVPAGVRQIDVGSHRVTAAAKVARIIRWFDALPIAQPGAFSCMLLRGPLETISFLNGKGVVLARASVLYNRGVSGPCNPISFSVGGRKEQPLFGGRFLLRVNRLLR
jgi:hypothetical protein